MWLSQEEKIQKIFEFNPCTPIINNLDSMKRTFTLIEGEARFSKP